MRLPAFALFIALSAGCATLRDDAVAATNAAADLGASAEVTLEDLDRREQIAAIASATTEAEATRAVASVRARYAGAWTAYRRFRVAWLAAAAATHAYDAAAAAHRAPDAASILRAVQSLADAEAALTAATVALTVPTVKP